MRDSRKAKTSKALLLLTRNSCEIFEKLVFVQYYNLLRNTRSKFQPLITITDRSRLYTQYSFIWFNALHILRIVLQWCLEYIEVFLEIWKTFFESKNRSRQSFKKEAIAFFKDLWNWSFLCFFQYVLLIFRFVIPLVINDNVHIYSTVICI